jgi:hypothetical protein
MRFNAIAWCLVVLVSVWAVSPCAAQPFLYSVDRGAYVGDRLRACTDSPPRNDRLVRINAATGDVTVIGTGWSCANLPEFGPDLTFSNGSVWGVYHDRDALTRVVLVQISPSTGAELGRWRVRTFTGLNAWTAEGLAELNGELLIGYQAGGGQDASQSYRLGRFAIPTGSGSIQPITEIDYITATGDIWTDFDSLGVDPTNGQLVCMDFNAVGVHGRADFVRSSVGTPFGTNPTTARIATYGPTPRGPQVDDLVFAGTRLFGLQVLTGPISLAPQNLFEHNPANGAVISQVPIQFDPPAPAYNLRGLALAELGCASIEGTATCRSIPDNGWDGDYIYTFTITNNSGRPVTSALFPVGGVTPSSYSFINTTGAPLAPGATSSPITVRIDGPIAGGTFNFPVILYAAGANGQPEVCCNVTEEIVLPDCLCFQLTSGPTVSCAPGDDRFQVSFTLQPLAYGIGHVFIMPPQRTLTPSEFSFWSNYAAGPTYFNVNTPAGGTTQIATVFETEAFGSNVGSTQCMAVFIHTPDLAECCMREVCFVVPDCGGRGGVGPTCDDIDFNNNNVFPEDQDVIDFFNVLAGGACSRDPFCADIDFNNNGVFPEDQDVMAFFSRLAGGPCM